MAGSSPISILVKDLGAGTDQLSPETSIPEGYSERLINYDPKAEGYLSKRVGYVGYSGNLPVRVSSFEYTDDATSNIRFTLDRSVDFSTTRSSPLVAYGRTRTAHSAGDWTSTDSAHYYPGFSPQIKKTLLAASTTTVTVPASEHSQNTAAMLVGTTASTSLVNNSNSHFYPDSLSIDTTTFDVTIVSTNGSASDVDFFSYYLKQDPVSGSIYNGTHVVGAGTVTVSIPQATHLLSSNRIQSRIYSVSGSTRTEVIPDEMRILSNGDVELDFVSLSGFTAFVILSVAPLTNLATTSLVPSLTEQTVTFPITSAFIFPTIYRENGTTLEQVLADSIEIDADALEATVTFTNTGISATFQIYWQYGSITSNTISVDGAVIGPGDVYTEMLPQLTLWGLDHNSLYGAGSRGGWVNHIDTYRTSSDQRVVSGLGGNLFNARTYAEVGEAYLLPLLYPSLRHRVNGLQYIGPVFWATGDAPGLTRGSIESPSAMGHEVSSPIIEWDGSLGWMKYSLSVPGMSITGSLSTIIRTTSGLEDYLTVSGAGSARLNGTFKIRQVTQTSATTIDIWVENDNVDGSDWDETDSGALVGIFTDSLALDSSSTFLDGDTLTSEVFANSEIVTVKSSSGSTVVFDGLFGLYSMGNNLVVVGNRTSEVMPIRTLAGAASVTNLVPGDLLEYTGLARQIRILSINSDIERSITIDSSGGTAVVTLTSGDTNVLTEGQKILLLRAGVFSGVQTITSIDSLTSFSFDSNEVVSGQTGALAGKTITVDEALAWADSPTSAISVTVASRWIPIESPDDSFDLTPSTTQYHFDTDAYDSQEILRSTMSADNLYLSQGSDEVMKFDGANLYRAGLPRWQSHLFLTTDTTGGGNIVINTPSSSVTAVSGLKFTVSLADFALFSVGDEIAHSADGAEYTIIAIESDATATYVRVDKTITGGASGTIRGILNAKYYMRLNAIDSNDNVIASAIVGADDNVARLSVDGKVRLRLVGMPVLGNYDYNRLEAEIYRTKFARGFDSATLSVFYKLATLPMSFNRGDGYLDYTDTDSDIVLRDADPTASLTGAELGTTFSQPLRAASVTSAGNRVVLGNIKDYPRINVQMNQSGTLLTSANLAPLSWLLRKDNTDTGTSTDMVNRAAYDWVNSGSLTIGVGGIVRTDATTLTVTTTAPHGQVSGNWVYLYKAAVTNGALLQHAGWYQLASTPTISSFTVYDTSSSITSVAADVDRCAVATTAGNIPVWLGTDGNYGMYNGNTAGTTSYLFTATRRLANAINASMRKTNVALTGQSSFSPWVVASAGNEFASGQLVLEQPFVAETNLELKLPAFTNFTVYGNGVSREASAEVGSITNLFPSRILISYPNYAELFDNPTAINDTESASAVDVNSADGQEVVTCIPFFGDSAFGAAQKSGIVVVFKTNSIYLVDLAAKAAGQNPVQRIESQGQGCTAPGSVTVTRDGIMFANDSGIYKLTRSLTVDYIGRRMERIWRKEVDRTLLALAAGHHFNAGSQYKLSAPMLANDDVAPSQAFVYDHTREYRADGYGQGSWTEYTNHAALGWCNLRADAFWGSTNGRVYKLRRTNTISDYRDDASAVEGEATLRAMDFGDPSIRKAVSDVIIYHRTNTATTENITVSSAADLEDSFNELDPTSVKANASGVNGLSTLAFRKVVGVRYSLLKRKSFYIQLRISSTGIDQPSEIAAIAYRVSGLTSAGATDAKDT